MKILIQLILLLCSVSLIAQKSEFAKAKTELAAQPSFAKALQLQFTNPDSASVYYKKNIEHNREEKDTLKIILGLVELARLNTNLTRYEQAYDGYWHALSLVDKIDNKEAKGEVYEDIVWLYSFYERWDVAMSYAEKALQINKELIASNVIENKGIVVHNYYQLAVVAKEKGDYENALTYLDSFAEVNRLHGEDKIANQNFLDSERGIVFHYMKKDKKALELLLPTQEWYTGHHEYYQALLHTYIGDAYRGNGDLKKSQSYYESALNMIHTYNKHLNYEPLLYQKLSDLFLQQENYKEAYLYLDKAKEINEDLYGSRSLQNRHLLEIKDAFRVGKENQQKSFATQKMIQLEQQKKLSLLKILILVGALILMGVIGFLVFRNQRIRHEMNQQILTEQKEQEITQQKELLELKNKELTANALEIIAKDEFLEQLQTSLVDPQTNINRKALLRMIKAEQSKPSANWAMFEAQFTAVNNSFFVNLKEDFPKLSQTELRLCALIKLTFSSKDMAKLLGISVESVHTARYRLRKKMQLGRSANLTEFISGY